MGEQYDPPAYLRAVMRACEAAGVTRFSPHKVRHAAATAIRKRYDLESAQVVLGHTQANVTQLYAQRDFEKAARVIAEIG